MTFFILFLPSLLIHRQNSSNAQPQIQIVLYNSRKLWNPPSLFLVPPLFDASINNESSCASCNVSKPIDGILLFHEYMRFTPSPSDSGVDLTHASFVNHPFTSDPLPCLPPSNRAKLICRDSLASTVATALRCDEGRGGGADDSARVGVIACMRVAFAGEKKKKKKRKQQPFTRKTTSARKPSETGARPQHSTRLAVRQRE